MNLVLLIDLVQVLGLASLVLLVCLRLKLPSMVGLLLAGVLVGPNGLKLVGDTHDVEILAEIGVILLLFTIGLEFSVSHLNRLRRAVLLGGGVQVAGTILVCALLAMALSLPPNQAIFLGFLLSLSSTAIVLKELQARAAVDTPHGQSTVSILIFQDVAVMGMILMTPVLAGGAGSLIQSGGLALAKLAGVVLFVAVAARQWMPWLLFQVVRTRSRELFMLVIATICMVTPWLGYELGLSFGLGAFIAGLIISETDYSHQVLAGFIPLRDVFTSLFFVSIGMLLDVQALVEQPVLIVCGVAALVLIKSVVATGSVLLLRYPLRTSLLAGLSLAQVGEFSFLLAGEGLRQGLIGQDLFQPFIAMTIVSMALTPLMIVMAPRVAQRALQWPWSPRMCRLLVDGEIIQTPALENHVVIIGFGLGGHNVARSLRGAGIPYLILEINAETVRREKLAGEPIHYGDATQETVLESVGMGRAQTLVVSLPDPVETRRITHAALLLNPALHVVARTRFASEVGPLRELGAADIVADEMEASIEMVARVLHQHAVPRSDIDHYLRDLRADDYRYLRGRGGTVSPEDLGLHRGELDIQTLTVGRGAPAIGRTLAQLDLRQRHGVSLLAIRRGGDVLANPPAQTALQADDLLVLYGAPAGLEALETELRTEAA